MSGEVLTLKEACARLGFSQDFGRKLLAEGRFPVPPLERLGHFHRFSAVLIDEYLRGGDLGGDAA